MIINGGQKLLGQITKQKEKEIYNIKDFNWVSNWIERHFFKKFLILCLVFCLFVIHFIIFRAISLEKNKNTNLKVLITFI